MPAEDPDGGPDWSDRDDAVDQSATDGTGSPDRDARRPSGTEFSANGGATDATGTDWDASAGSAVGTGAEPPPPPREIEHAFHVTEVRTEGDRIYYFGHALVSSGLAADVEETFADAGYTVSHVERAGEDVIVARPRTTGDDGAPWTHVLLFVLTVASTLFFGSMWFFVDPVQNPDQIWRGWPFSLGIMTVLGVHEMGHYAMAQRHDVDATLPYFIPVPTLIGTMGAVIRMKGRMPNRKALFDIGIAGPIAGLVATVVVTVIGLHLDPITAAEPPENAQEIAIGFPPLMQFLAWATGQPLTFDDAYTSVHPLVYAGWVGMFVTFLNLIPVGQLDGGHVVRALAPNYQETIAAAVPALLYGLAGYLVVVEGVALQNASLWIVWGTITLGLAFVGPARPTSDAAEIGSRRRLLGIATFLVGLTCFAPVPIAIVG